MKHPAFTLIELLVVIAIIGLLATFSVVQLAGSREKARIAKGSSMSGQILRSLGDEALLRWDFDECSGTSVADQSGSGANGTLVNGVAWSSSMTPTNTGCSVYLDGTDDYLSSAVTQLPFANRSFSISAWGARSRTGAYDFIVTAGNSPALDSTLYFGFTDTNVFQCGFYSDSLYTSQTFLDNKWHHIACTFDATTKKRMIYVDGSLVASGVAIGAFIGTNTVEIGRRYGPAYYYRGYMDDLRIYGRAMTSREIHQIYAEGEKNIGITKK